MSKDWQIILRFAAIGFLVATAIYIYSAFYDYTKPWTVSDTFLGILSFIFCPASLLGVLCIDCEVGTSAGAFLWCVVGLGNSIVYAVVGALYVGLRKRPEEHVSS